MQKIQAWDAGRGPAEHPNDFIRAMRRKPWRVVIEYYRLDPGHVGKKTGDSMQYIHHTGKAALRRLGSLIRGKLARTVQRPGYGAALGVYSPGNTLYTYNELQALLRDPARMRSLGLLD